MRLTDHLSQSGTALFRWRSYLLFAFIPLMIWAMLAGKRIEAAWGWQASVAYDALCILMIAAGEVIRCLTVGFVPDGTSGRNVQGQLATRLNTSGAYSMLRNPLYLGNSLMYVGIVLLTQSPGLGLVMALVLLPYYERIIATEESFLTEKFGADYVAFTQRSPAFIPNFRGWQSPDLAFSWRMVIRRELTSIYGAVLAVYLVESGLRYFAGQPIAPIWHWIAGVATVLVLIAIYLKRRTSLLNAPKR